jgi:isoleucyl-tRNA synthetase
VVWTTTPWTLPANVAATVHPEHLYGRRENGEWVAVDRYPEEDFVETLSGREMEGWGYDGPFDELEAGSGIEHRVIIWDEVNLDQGTGIVHIAPGCGAEDYELGRANALPVLMPVDESGRFYPQYGWLAGLGSSEARTPIAEDLEKRGLLVEAGEYVHSYPHCWRCDTPLIFRIADDWYIAVDQIRDDLRQANRTIEWTPAYMGKLMDDWLVNMGDWNISRRRYYGLPLPFYLCECGHLTVVGSRANLAELATAGMDQLEELHRPWIDRVTIRCAECGNTSVTRVTEVGDVWLDAGIVPMSTLGWGNEEWVEEGQATGAAAGLTTADLPDHAYWEEWFPADWVTEMREQVRLWFYSQLFMSVAMVGEAPFRAVLGYEKMLAEDGREMHGSWGNLISAEEAFEQMGADVMRWMYCAHPPDRNLLFGYAGAHEVRRRLLTLWNSAKFLIDYGNIEGFVPNSRDLHTTPEDAGLTEIDRWLLARVDRAIEDATDALDRWRSDELIAGLEGYLDDLSNWYIRRNRRRFYEYDEAAFRTLWIGVVTALRVISPVMPFLTEHLWSSLVARPCPEAPESIHLAGWPQPMGNDDPDLLAEMEVTRQIVELGRRARNEAGIKLRQPLRTALIRGGDLAHHHAEIIKDELRVKDLVFDAEAVVEISYKPDFAVVGPRIGAKVKEVAAALASGEYQLEEDGTIVAAGVQLSPNDVIRTETVLLEGWGLAQDGNLSVAVDPDLDEALVREGRVLELVRALNEQRKQEGLELTDRIGLRLPGDYADLIEEFGSWIAAEVLAVGVTIDERLDSPAVDPVG